MEFYWRELKESYLKYNKIDTVQMHTFHVGSAVL